MVFFTSFQAGLRPTADISFTPTVLKKLHYQHMETGVFLPYCHFSVYSSTS